MPRASYSSFRPLLSGLVAIVAACGNGGAAPESIVTIRDAEVPVCDASSCMAVVCGDGIVASGDEGCDDGNLLGGDGCSPICQLELCGNGIKDPGEECDPPGEGCTEECKLPLVTCGNGMVDQAAGEECDDGNSAKGDGCRNCRKECGDSVLDREIGEECEPAFTPKDENGVSTTCTPACRRKPFCGDAKLNRELGEECDPVDGRTCINDCKLAPVGSRPDAGADGGTCTPLPTSADGGALEGDMETFLPNGAFDADLAGWTSGGTVEASFVAGQGAAKPGAAQVTHRASASSTSLSVDGVQRCVVISAGDQYEFEARYFNQQGQPAGTRAFAVVLLFPNATCSGTPATGGPGSAPTSEQAGMWLSYKLRLDTAALGSLGAPVSVLVKLGVLVSPGKSGTALWDDASLRSRTVNPNCGNCKIDPGETCDDGNRKSRDGCSALCHLEGNQCGNGARDPGEECDTGATSFVAAGTCTPLCKLKTRCDECAISTCRTRVDACLGLPGVAEAGGRKGMARSLLCGRLRDCVAQSGCSGKTAISTREPLAGTAGEYLENCYCGTAGKACLTPSTANGSCRAEIEAALETSVPSEILQRLGGSDPRYPIVAAMADLKACESSVCTAECASDLKCGNGLVQERTADFFKTFQLSIAGKKEPCSDALTPSKLGCSFEECDGQVMCDENCFLLKCGNRLLQKGEDCDDGNLVAGDGCGPTCKAEFTCGDSQVADKFGEQCDPPNSGKLCTMAEFTANPASCGCGSTCKYKVCGNGIVQDGEQCDPPNGSTCGANCQLAGLGECVDCMLLVGDTTPGCPYGMFLKGNRDVPGFEQGCLDNKPCYDYLRCGLDNRCGLARTTTPSPPSACFCGLGAGDVDMCDAPTFEPKGPCKAQVQSAYEAQFGTPFDKAEYLARFYDLPPPGRPPALASVLFSLQCLLELEGQLMTAGVAPAKANSCLTACLGPP